MPVVRPGRTPVTSSAVLLYSNSKPTMSRLMPTAKPRGGSGRAASASAPERREVGWRRRRMAGRTSQKRWRARATSHDTSITTIGSNRHARRAARTCLCRAASEAVVVSPHGSASDRRAGSAAPHRPGVRRGGDSAPRDDVGRGAGVSAELVPKLAALGLMGIQVPEADGGAGLSAVDYCICIEELARVDPSVALSVAAHNGLCVAHLSMFGTAGAEGEVPRAAGAGRDARRVGADRSRAPAATRRRCGRRRAATATAGCSTAASSSSRTAHRRHAGGHGGHRPRQGATASRRSSSRAARRDSRPARRKTSSACARATRAR